MHSKTTLLLSESNAAYIGQNVHLVKAQLTELAIKIIKSTLKDNEQYHTSKYNTK